MPKGELREKIFLLKIKLLEYERATKCTLLRAGGLLAVFGVLVIASRLHLGVGVILIITIAAIAGFVWISDYAEDKWEEEVKQGEMLICAYFNKILTLKRYNILYKLYTITPSGLSWKITYRVVGDDGVKRDSVLFCTTSYEGITPKGDRTYSFLDLGIGF